MRSIRLLLCLGFIALGCNNSNNNTGSGGEDMSVATDMTMAMPDMAMPANTPLGCNGVLQCLMGGGAGAAGCLARATPKAQGLLAQLIDCGKAACGDYDGGPGSCAGASDQSQACLQCAAGDIQSGDCMPELQACLADM
jgi:hypothetical protein